MKPNPTPISIDAGHCHLYNITHADDSMGIAQIAVGHFADMHQAIMFDTDIDERTEVDHVARGAHQYHALAQVFHR